jgi:hypothetical protein
MVVASITIPMSPAIQKSKPKNLPKDKPDNIIKAKPVPRLKRFEPVIPHRQIPISDYSLPGDKISQKKQKIQADKIAMDEKKKEEAVAFYAQELPNMKKVDLFFIQVHKIVHTIQVTEPEPFMLETDLRGSIHKRVFDELQYNAALKEQSDKMFTARPIPHVLDEPFVPEKSFKPLTVVQEVVLNSDIRSAERLAFDADLAARQQEEERAVQEHIRLQQVSN